MSYFDSIFADAKDEANRLCTLDFSSFEGYREISEDDLPSDQFYGDEWKQQQSVKYKSFLAPAVLLIAGVVLFILWISNPMTFLLILFSLILLSVGIYASFTVYRRSQEIDTAGYSCNHLGRGIILCRTTVQSNAASAMTRGAFPNIQTQNRTDNRAIVHFVSVFFPDSKTFIRNVFCSDGGLRKTFNVGDTVVVYRHSDSGEADLLPSTHVNVTPELLTRIRAEQIHNAQTSKVKVTVTNKKTLRVYLVIFLIILLSGLLPFFVVLILALLKIPITFT